MVALITHRYFAENFSQILFFFFFSVTILHFGLKANILINDDYSYGVYLYAFPLQQFFTSQFHFTNPYVITVLTSIFVFVCAYLSWHKVEHPLLKRKKDMLQFHKFLIVLMVALLVGYQFYLYEFVGDGVNFYSLFVVSVIFILLFVELLSKNKFRQQNNQV